MAFYCLDCRFRGNDIADPSIRLKCYEKGILPRWVFHSFPGGGKKQKNQSINPGRTAKPDIAFLYKRQSCIFLAWIS